MINTSLYLIFSNKIIKGADYLLIELIKGEKWKINHQTFHYVSTKNVVQEANDKTYNG